MDVSDESNAPRGGDISTPTSRWVAPHVLWAGTDDNVEVKLNSATSATPPLWDANTRRQSSQSVVGDGPPRPLKHTARDPRSLFGDLPNSSYDGVLTDPIERELRRRSAAVQEHEATAPVSSDPPQQKTNEDTITLDVEQQVDEGAGVVTARTGPAVDDVGAAFWMEECRRLQGELANLARQRDRWEQERIQLCDMDADHARELTGLKRAVEAQSQLVMESLVTTQRLAAEGASMMMAAAEGYNNAPFQQSRYLHPASPWVHPNPPPSRTSSNALTTTRSPAVALARRRLEVASEATNNRTSFQDPTADDHNAEKNNTNENDEGEQIPVRSRIDREHHHNGRSRVSNLFNRRYQRERGGSRRQHQMTYRQLLSQRSVRPQTLEHTPDTEVEHKTGRTESEMEKEREERREEERVRRRWSAAYSENDRSLTVAERRGPSRKHEQSRPSHYWPTSVNAQSDSSPPASAHAGSSTRRFPETVLRKQVTPPAEADWRRWGQLHDEHFITNEDNKDVVERCDINGGQRDGINGRGLHSPNALRTAADIDAEKSQQTQLCEEHYSTDDGRAVSLWQKQHQLQQQSRHDQRYLSPYATTGNSSQLYLPPSKQEREEQQQQEQQRQRRRRSKSQQGVRNSRSSRVYNDRARGRWKKLDSSDGGGKVEARGKDDDHVDDEGRSSGATEEVWEWRGRKVILIQPASTSSQLRKTSRLEMHQEEAEFNSGREYGTYAEDQERPASAKAAAMIAGTPEGVEVETPPTGDDTVALIDELKQVREAIHALAGEESDRPPVSFALYQEADAASAPLPTAALTPTVTPPTACSSPSTRLHQPVPSVSASSSGTSISVDNNTSATTTAIEHESKHGPTPSRRSSTAGSLGVDEVPSPSAPSSACPSPNVPKVPSPLGPEDDGLRRHTVSSVERDVEEVRPVSDNVEPSVAPVSAARTGDGGDDQRVSDGVVNAQEGQNAAAFVGIVEKDMDFDDARGQEGPSVQETSNLADADVDGHSLPPEDEISGHGEAEEISGTGGMTTVDDAHHGATDAVSKKHDNRHFVACCPG